MKMLKISEIYYEINKSIKLKVTVPEIVIYKKDTYLYNRNSNDYFKFGTKERLFKNVKHLDDLAQVCYMNINELINYNNDLIDLANRSRECRSDLYKNLNGLRDYINSSEYLKNSSCSEEIEKFLEEIENDIDNL